MSEQIYSPRVRLTEVDRSQLPPVQTSRTALVLGGTQKGNYFTPMDINLANIDSKIGLSTQNNIKEYTSMTAEQFLRGGASNVKVIPITNTQDYSLSDSYSITVDVATETYTVAVLFLTAQGVSESVSAIAVTGDADDATVTATGGTTVETGVDFTTEAGIKRFFEKYSNPKSATKDFYVKYVFDVSQIADGAPITTPAVASSGSAVEMLGFTKGKSPWVNSQNGERLFRFEMLQSSASANRDINIQIEDIETGAEINPNDPSYGRFTVNVYKYKSKNAIKDAGRSSNDNEVILESFVCSLNPQALDYIARVIGTRSEYYDMSDGQLKQSGLYANRSQFVRVEMVDGASEIPTESVPWGFDAYDQAYDYFDGQPVPYFRDPSSTQDGGVNFDLWYIDFLHTELPSTPFAVNQTYALPDVPANVVSAERRFRFGFFGGTKGTPDVLIQNLGEDITPSNVVGFDLSDNEADGYADYKRALDMIADPEFIKFNILFMPAVNVQQHPAIINYALNILESRGDAILFVDAGQAVTTENQLVQDVATAVDSSYVASFDPWLLSDRNVLIPPVVAVARSIAINDRNFKPWYSLIGFERGLIYGVADVVRKYNQKSKDNLVKNRINPIAKYLNQIGIFGQETMHQADTLLRQYPIRRLLIEAKEGIGQIASQVIGKQLTDATIDSLEGQIRDFLTGLREDRGVRFFDVQFERDRDDLTNRGIIRGRIILQPVTSVKGVELTFTVTDQGVSFSA